MICSNEEAFHMFSHSSYFPLPTTKGQYGTRAETKRVVQEGNADTQKFIKGASDTWVHSFLSFVFIYFIRVVDRSISLSTLFVLLLTSFYSEVIPDGNGDYLLAFKGRKDDAEAGVSTRAYGDHFTSSAEIVNGALIQCLPIAEVARMVNNLVEGVSGLSN